MSLIFPYSAQILLENALFYRQKARLKNRLFCSKFWRQNSSKPISNKEKIEGLPKGYRCGGSLSARPPSSESLCSPSKRTSDECYLPGVTVSWSHPLLELILTGLLPESITTWIKDHVKYRQARIFNSHETWLTSTADVNLMFLILSANLEIASFSVTRDHLLYNLKWF